MKFHVLRACTVATAVEFFHKVQSQHFSGVLDRFQNACVEFLQDSVHQKLFKFFHRVIQKIKNVATCFGTEHKEL